MADVMQRLDAVEIQETFYKPVRTERAKKWRRLAPREFRFCVKASQFITHEASSPTYRRSGRTIPAADRGAYGGFRDTPRVREGWEATQAVAEALEASAIVFQAPSSFGPSDANRAALYRFFESIRTSSVKVIELRGPWAVHVVERICEDLGLVHAVDPFEREPATYGLAYFRLPGSPPGPAMHRYTYADADLARLDSICREYDDAYVLFNNLTMNSDARRFLDVVRDAGGTKPPARE